MSVDKKQKRPWLILHGVAMFVVLLGGFGLLARLGIVREFPGWVWVKLVIWGLLGGSMAFVLRKTKFSKLALGLILGAGIIAAVVATNKPMF